MDKNIKITVIMLFISILFLSIIIFIGINYGSKAKEKENKIEAIPKITEEYTNVSLRTLKKYYNYLDYDGNQIVYYDDNKEYLVYKNGVFYDEKIIDDSVNKPSAYTFKNYIVKLDYENDKYSITTKKNNNTEYFDSITLVMNKDEEINYLILENENELYLLNINNNTRISLREKDIKSVINNNDEGTIITEKFDYLPVCSTYDKCGLITYDGTTAIEFTYDWIDYYNKDYIIVYKNDKTGLINYKNETILNVEYDYIEKYGNYTFTVKNNILNILNDKFKTIVGNIAVTESGEDRQEPYNFDVYIDNNNIIYILIEGLDNVLYKINNNNEKHITSKGIFEFIFDNDEELKYPAFKFENNGKLIYEFYDKNLNKIYTIERETKKNVDYYAYAYNIDGKPDYYSINITYYIDEYSDNIYIDMKKLKETTEYDAFKKYFKNGYSYVINNGSLKIYKDTELLTEFDGDYTYIDGYKFIANNGDSTYDIIEVEFKKESREVEQQ